MAKELWEQGEPDWTRWGDSDPKRPFDRIALYGPGQSGYDLSAELVLETMTSRELTAKVAEVHDRITLTPDEVNWLIESLLAMRRQH